MRFSNLGPPTATLVAFELEPAAKPARETKGAEYEKRCSREQDGPHGSARSLSFRDRNEQIRCSMERKVTLVSQPPVSRR
jgi:hypothetical protein